MSMDRRWWDAAREANTMVFFLNTSISKNATIKDYLWIDNSELLIFVCSVCSHRFKIVKQLLLLNFHRCYLDVPLHWLGQIYVAWGDFLLAEETPLMPKSGLSRTDIGALYNRSHHISFPKSLKMALNLWKLEPQKMTGDRALLQQQLNNILKATPVEILVSRLSCG